MELMTQQPHHEDMLGVLREFQTGIFSGRDADDQPWLSLISLANTHDVDVVDIVSPTRSPPLGYAALHYATFYGKSEYVSLLLNRGAFVDVLNVNGSTPLFVAATFKDRCHGCARILLRHGADVNVKVGWRGTTPLHHAVQVGFLDMALILLDGGACPNTTQRNVGEELCSALYVAISNGDKTMTTALVKAGASVENDGSTRCLRIMAEERGSHALTCWKMARILAGMPI